VKLDAKPPPRLCPAHGSAEAGPRSRSDAPHSGVHPESMQKRYTSYNVFDVAEFLQT
jgi:hypothetical protein